MRLPPLALLAACTPEAPVSDGPASEPPVEDTAHTAVEPDPEPERPPCGGDGTAFVVHVTDAVVLPVKPATEGPWDWDGDLPDWLVGTADALGAITREPTLLTAAQVLEVVDRVAPRLLEGTVPPDPELVAAIDGGGEIGVERAADDTYAPRFDVRAPITLAEGDTLRFSVFDDDPLGRDPVGVVVFDVPSLRARVGCGPERIRGTDGLYALGFEVTEP